MPAEDEGQVHWTVALAGGEGTRLQDYVQRRFGRRVPKQYCQLLGTRSMLQHTLGRLNQLTPPSRTITVIGTDHGSHAMPQVAGSSDHVLCQPSSRDTGIALYVALAMIKRWAPNATVTITPTDHYVEPSARYLDHVRVARRIATRVRDIAVLLGARPNEPDPELGYMTLGKRLGDLQPDELGAHTLVDFIEKPSVEVARQLMLGGVALWNTMVGCATVDAFWSIGRCTAPHLIAVLDCLVPLIGTPDESEAIEYIYRAYRPLSFSAEILRRSPKHLLAAVELDGVEWSDWGRPERVETMLAVRRDRALMRSALDATDAAT